MAHFALITGNSQTPTPMPTFCRHCGNVMAATHRAADVQTNGAGQTRVIPASTIVTCKNAHCTLNGYTFEAKTYQREDLSIYGVRAVQS